MTSSAWSASGFYPYAIACAPPPSVSCGVKLLHASRHRLPPPPPLLLLSPNSCSRTKHLCSPDDSWVFRVPRKLVNKRFVGSHNNGWIAAIDSSELMIVNLFSGAEVVIYSTRPGYLQNPFAKIIFSQVPTSSSCIIAAISSDWLSIALCKVGCNNMWITKGCRKQIFGDIAFCNGDLYGLLHRSKELVKFGISMEEDGIPMVTSTHHLSVQRFLVPIRILILPISLSYMGSY
ncbi:hypothetical protein ZWY2020_020036 [Hordeum vulgare]|nr:hypothetical protein ZWY2020_020036 [Hordeum vulgare]